MRYVGHVATQSRGTFGGSAAHADPAAEIPALLLAVEAEFVARGAKGERAIPADEFFHGYFTTALSESEVLTAIRVPTQKGVRATFLEVSRRHGDFALVGVAVAARLEADGTVRSPRVVVAGVSGTPRRMESCEGLLEGRSLDTPTLAEAGAIVADELEPRSDVHASASYRRHVAGVLVRRALAELRR
jgi:carbon-monoxide dehydrogenase medium subunit